MRYRTMIIFAGGVTSKSSQTYKTLESAKRAAQKDMQELKLLYPKRYLVIGA